MTEQSAENFVDEIASNVVPLRERDAQVIERMVKIRDGNVAWRCINATCYWCSKRVPREGDYHQAECGPVRCNATGIWDMLAGQGNLPGIENNGGTHDSE